jgi:hypothetical protein
MIIVTAKIGSLPFESVKRESISQARGKEHRKVEEQGAMIARQQKQIETLTTGLQKVSAQLAAVSLSRSGLEASKFATGRIRGGGPRRKWSTILRNASGSHAHART